MPEIEQIERLFLVAPTITITLMCVALGWWARGKSADKHVTDLKDFIKFLQERDK